MEPANFARQLAEVSLRLHRRLRQEAGVHGLTGARLAALRRLVGSGPLSMGELALSEDVAAATMTRIVDALEQEKLVIRRHSPHDGRVVELVPTALGRSLALGSERNELRWLERILADLNEDERAAVRRAVKVLAERIEEELLPGAPGRRTRKK